MPYGGQWRLGILFANHDGAEPGASPKLTLMPQGGTLRAREEIVISSRALRKPKDVGIFPSCIVLGPGRI